MKKYRRVMSHDTEEWWKVWRKTLGSKNDKKNVNVSSGKSENLHFDVVILSIAYKLSTKNLQKNCLSWHWKEIQTLKLKTDFFFEKWYKEFGEF